MHGSEKNFCIKCDGGGKVLCCSDSGCPIGVHEKCLGFAAKFDDVGNFYCPYCSYRRATEEYHRAMEKALLGKKALSCFMDMQMLDKNKHMYEGGVSEQKELGNLQNNVKKNYNLDNENILDQAILQGSPVQPEEGLENKFVPHNARRHSLNKEKLSVSEKDALSIKCDGVNAHPIECNDHLCSDKRTQQHFGMAETGRWNQLENHELLNSSSAVRTNENHIEERCFSDFLLGEKQGRENYFSSSAKDVDNGPELVTEDEDHIEGKDDIKCLVQEKVSSFVNDTGTTLLAVEEKEECKTMKPYLALPLNMVPSSRRKKLLWGDDEEEMIRKGVQKYSRKGNKNIPWRKILEFGRHVFHDTRTPVDLKDKWRNIAGKRKR